MRARQVLGMIIEAERHSTPNWISRVGVTDVPLVLKTLRSAGIKPRAVYRDRSGMKRYHRGPHTVSGWSLKKDATHADIYRRPHPHPRLQPHSRGLSPEEERDLEAWKLGQQNDREMRAAGSRFESVDEPRSLDSFYPIAKKLSGLVFHSDEAYVDFFGKGEKCAWS